MNKGDAEKGKGLGGRGRIVKENEWREKGMGTYLESHGGAEVAVPSDGEDVEPLKEREEMEGCA